jgi:hypothetical protein
MKRLLLLLIFFCSVTAMQGQSFEQQMGIQADSLTKKFDAQLSLTEKQYMLFCEKVKVFMIKRRALMTKNLSTEEKNDRLKAMYAEEAGELRDVLKAYQFEVYQDIRSKLQPLVQLRD